MESGNIFSESLQPLFSAKQIAIFFTTILVAGKQLFYSDKKYPPAQRISVGTGACHSQKKRSGQQKTPESCPGAWPDPTRNAHYCGSNTRDDSHTIHRSLQVQRSFTLAKEGLEPEANGNGYLINEVDLRGEQAA